MTQTPDELITKYFIKSATEFIDRSTALCLLAQAEERRTFIFKALEVIRMNILCGWLRNHQYATKKVLRSLNSYPTLPKSFYDTLETNMEGCWALSVYNGSTTIEPRVAEEYYWSKMHITMEEYLNEFYNRYSQ